MWHVVTGFTGENLTIGNLRNLNGCEKRKYRNLIERTQSQKKDLRKNKEKRYYIAARKKSRFSIFHLGYEPLRRLPRTTNTLCGSPCLQHM